MTNNYNCCFSAGAGHTKSFRMCLYEIVAGFDEVHDRA